MNETVRLEVIQADRDAAADWLACDDDAPDMLHFAKCVREGHEDAHSLVQAFARHRIAHAHPAHEPMLSALEKAAAWFRDYERQHRAKLTQEGELKADVNADRAAFLEAAIALARRTS